MVFPSQTCCKPVIIFTFHSSVWSFWKLPSFSSDRTTKSTFIFITKCFFSFKKELFRALILETQTELRHAYNKCNEQDIIAHHLMDTMNWSNQDNNWIMVFFVPIHHPVYMLESKAGLMPNATTLHSLLHTHHLHINGRSLTTLLLCSLTAAFHRLPAVSNSSRQAYVSASFICSATCFRISPFQCLQLSKAFIHIFISPEFSPPIPNFFSQAWAGPSNSLQLPSVWQNAAKHLPRCMRSEMEALHSSGSKGKNLS